LKESVSRLVAIMLAIFLITGISTCFVTQCLGQTQTQLTKVQSPFAETTLTIAPIVVAAPVVSNDTNWAGYIIASDLQNPEPTVTGISASWTVTSVVPSTQQDTFAAVWIGIGGFFDNSLIQIGTEQDSIRGEGYYSAWYEFLPEYSHTIDNIIVSPGDQVTASIQLIDAVNGTWSIYIEDLTTMHSFNGTVDYPASQLSAEWVVERPTSGHRLTPLSDIGTVSFTDCQATIGTQTGSISSFPALQSVMFSSVQNTEATTQLTAVSSLSNDGTSFTVETSPSAIPEFSNWLILPLTMGTILFTVALRKIHTKNKHQ
jgi:hypothetical protein